MSLAIRRAGLDDLDALAPLFHAYRVFYAQAEPATTSRDFIAERLQRRDSVVLLAVLDGGPAGFVQLYPMFSSVRAARVWVLNDLFVAAHARRRGIAQALLAAAADFAHADGALRLELETTRDNAAARQLYLAQGWQAYDDTLRFHLPLARD